MALLRRSRPNRIRIVSLLLAAAALALSSGCETGYLIEGFPVCDPFVHAEEPNVAAAPAALGLARFGPNPFVDATELHYALPRAGKLTVEVYDASGRRVEVLVDRDVPAGELALPWNVASSAAAGIYFVRASFGGRTVTEKLVLIR